MAAILLKFRFIKRQHRLKIPAIVQLVQELVPIGDGKYRIESRIEETTAPVAEASPHLPDEPPQDSIAAANNNRRAPTWIEEIAAERSGRWPVSNVDQV
ncbi:hypothetical protein NECAME_07127 [Necator americanus]|uniref:Uncharacterized protein n=1 Tax=Necator americanus TaxID=51031 RepID=W2TQ94_NECAM|nr:hypothetical protein NECAME_07127 [Necator americanus]ETN83973.1 hypothetical protein NECAME_07127 [Necator americanus]